MGAGTNLQEEFAVSYISLINLDEAIYSCLKNDSCETAITYGCVTEKYRKRPSDGGTDLVKSKQSAVTFLHVNYHSLFVSEFLREHQKVVINFSI